MYLANKDSNFISKKRFDIGTWFDQAPEEVQVTMKEPTTLQYLKIREVWKKQDEVEIIQSFYELFPELVVDHSFYVSESKKMSNQEVADLLFGKFEAITDLMKLYYEFLGESKKNSMKKSGK
jgi:predicted nuclease of restriction endonuclease-like (RecB) superfamily